MYLSLGERPVCEPVMATKAPPAPIVPSCWRIACSYSSGTDRL